MLQMAAVQRRLTISMLLRLDTVSSSQALNQHWPSSGVVTSVSPSGQPAHPPPPPPMMMVEEGHHRMLSQLAWRSNWPSLFILGWCIPISTAHAASPILLQHALASPTLMHFFICNLMSFHTYVFSYCCCWFPLAHSIILQPSVLPVSPTSMYVSSIWAGYLISHAAFLAVLFVLRVHKQRS